MINEKYENYVKLNINFPKECPVCHGAIEVTENGFVKCVNMSCPQKIVHKFGEALRILGVDGAGESMLNSFIENGINSVKELLASSEKMASLGTNEQKVAAAIVAAKAKPITMAKFFAMFDLDGFSEKKLAGLERHSAFSDFYRDPISTLTMLHDKNIESLATEYIDGFASYDVKLKMFTELFGKIREMTLAAPYLTFKQQASGPLAGISFCFTGAMAYARPTLERLVTNNSGSVKSSVTKGLNYLVQADPTSTSTKSKKARELGTEIITPEAFINMLIDKGVSVNL